MPSYGQILKSSAIIGGSSLLNIGFRILRTKAIALLLGASGVGLLGIFDSISDLTRTVAGLGINNSGVRQIAEAAGSGETANLNRTVTTLRRVALYSGAAGALLLLIFCNPISLLIFGNSQYAGAVALLALAAFFGDISQGQAALVQGMRRIGDLARMNVLGALYGTVISIPIIFYFREQGLVPALVSVAATSMLTSWWYARKIRVGRVTLTSRETFAQAAALLKLGSIIMVTSLMTMGTYFLIRVILLHTMGIEAAGFYQAAWVLGGLYIGFIVQAMGADFYPRLTAVANEHSKCGRLVNEQIEVGLLLAVPGVVATLTFAPIVLQLFYSANFGPAVEILRWLCLGMVLRVASWPMGYVLLAKGVGKMFFWIELCNDVTYLMLIWIGVKWFGLTGTGIAFFGSYVAYIIFINIVIRRLINFKFSAANIQLSGFSITVISVNFVSWYLLPGAIFFVFGTIVTIYAGIYSIKRMSCLITIEDFPRNVQNLFVLLRLGPSKNRV